MSKVYSVYDSKAEAYLQPFMQSTKGMAIRFIQNVMSDPNSQLTKSPADFTLFEIGEWDDSKGNFSMYPNKTNMGCILEFKQDK